MSEPVKKVKKRSRGGCHNCKRLKIKCDEQKPSCKSCTKYDVFCDYSLKLSWGGRPTKRSATTADTDAATTLSDLATTTTSSSSGYGQMMFASVDPVAKKPKLEFQQFDINSLQSPQLPVATPTTTTPNISTMTGPFNIGSSTRGGTRTPLSNQEVQRKISDIGLVFQPTPEQRLVNSSSFILEYNIPERKRSNQHKSNGKNRRSDTSRINGGDTTISSVENNSFLTPISSNSSTSPDGTSKSPSTEATVISYAPGQSPIATDNTIPISPISTLQQHQNIEQLLKDEGGETTNNNINSDDVSLSPPRFIPELSALESLNKLLDDEDNFLQDQQFIDDFIISEHAYSNSSSNNASYKSALLQVPLRNTYSASTVAYYNQRFSSLFAPPDHHQQSSSSNLFSALTPFSDASDDSSSSSEASCGSGQSPASIKSTSDHVTVIPRELIPLPDILLQVPVYRDLFYHFVNITADALVPVPRLYTNNPFRVVLPRMAMSTPHLLSLIIAYAATHKAKSLQQPEPVEMISKLLERTFDGLTLSLENEKEAMSDTTLATAIMLSSYSIVTSAAEDSWKTHLHGAREIVVARGIANSLSGGILSSSRNSSNRISDIGAGSDSGDDTGSSGSAMIGSASPIIGPQPLRVIHEDISSNEVLSFLIRVFAYIDVIGALSSSSASSVLTNNEQASQLWTIPSWNLSQQRQYVQDPFLPHSSHGAFGSNSSNQMQVGTWMNGGDPDIDFLLGIDLNLIPVLSKVSSLAKRRRNLERYPQKLTMAAAASEDADLISEGLELSKILISCCSSGELRRKERIKQGLNINVNVTKKNQEHKLLLQLATMNLTFGYAGLIHLYRRVLKLSTDSAPVQELVNMITDLLEENIPIGDSIEACMCFPIFTAACEVTDPTVRARYRARMNSMRRFGFGQVNRARELMEECWARNEPWTGIMDDLGWGLVLA